MLKGEFIIVNGFFVMNIKDNLKDQTLLIKDKLLLLQESLLSYNGGFVFFYGRKINGWNVVFNGEIVIL